MNHESHVKHERGEEAAHRDGSPYLGCWGRPGGCGFSHSTMLMIKPVALFEVGGASLLAIRGTSIGTRARALAPATM